VKPTLTFTLSPIPRELIAATTQEAERDGDGRHRDELGQVVAAERPRERARRSEARAHDRERDHERHERHAERLVHVQRGAGGPRVLRHELRVGDRGEEREHDREQERRPDRPADAVADRAHKRVDTGAQHVPDDEEEQHVAGDRPLQALLAGGGGRGDGGSLHVSALTSRGVSARRSRCPSTVRCRS
jgi:hypothetical protein